jgi:hypothetical protein
MDSIRAKFQCIVAKLDGESEAVTLLPVISQGDDDPNQAWAKSTPSGRLELNIDNPGAQGFFQEGREYIGNFQEYSGNAAR